jgi:PAS domain S-box-containing protein
MRVRVSRVSNCLPDDNRTAANNAWKMDRSILFLRRELYFLTDRQVKCLSVGGKSVAHRSEVAVLNESRDFRIEELFFSTTDTRGVIRHGNEVFARVAGYDPQELYGAPHSVIRHPEMPRVVFQLLWETIEAGKTIAAYVKNLAKDGRYYWVMAVVMPCDDGYLSIRLKPSSGVFTIVQDLYATLLQVEQVVEIEPKQRQAAMQASRQELERQLKSLGFATYEDFMQHALTLEISCRQKAMAGAHDSDPVHLNRQMAGFQKLVALQHQCKKVDTELQAVFDRLDEFKAMNVKFTEKSQSILQSADSIRCLSINATIAAHRLGNRAATLNVVAESLGAVANDSQLVISQLSERMSAVVSTLSHLIFDVAATKLQSEVSLQFLKEILEGSSGNLDRALERSLRTLFDQVANRVDQVFEHLKRTEGRMLELQSQLDKLNRNNHTLYFVQFTGQKESTGLGEARGFSVVFDEVRSHIAATKQECDSLAKSIHEVLHQVRKLSAQQTHFSESIGTLRHAMLSC